MRSKWNKMQKGLRKKEMEDYSSLGWDCKLRLFFKVIPWHLYGQVARFHVEYLGESFDKSQE